AAQFCIRPSVRSHPASCLTSERYFFFLSSSFVGLRPAPRTFMNFCRTSNQNGAPSDKARPVMRQPRILASHHSPVLSGWLFSVQPIGNGRSKSNWQLSFAPGSFSVAHWIELGESAFAMSPAVLTICARRVSSFHTAVPTAKLSALSAAANTMPTERDIHFSQRL